MEREQTKMETTTLQFMLEYLQLDTRVALKEHNAIAHECNIEWPTYVADLYRLLVEYEQEGIIITSQAHTGWEGVKRGGMKHFNKSCP